MFQRRFISGSPFLTPFLPEFYLKSETKIDPDRRLGLSRNSPQSMKPFTALVV